MNYIGDCTSKASPISTAFPQNMARKIHVLLVENDGKHHDMTKNMLHYFSYEVTTVKHPSAALCILSTGKAQFDLVMANMSSPDMSVFQLLQDAIKMNLLVVLMSNDDDALTTMRALQQGVFLCIDKPITMQIMEYLWQYVVREKVSRLKQNEQFREAIEYNELHKEFGNIEANQNNNCNAEGENKSKKKMTMEASQHGNVVFKKKVWTQWTAELHEKFMHSVTQLGEGRCYPKEILQLMNVPGLTRMQVASHLQICRNTNWRPPSERKPKQANVKVTPPTNKAPREKIVRFGSMPRPGTNSQFRIGMEEYHEIDHGREFMIGPPTKTNEVGDNHNKSSYNVYHPQLLHDHGNYPFAADQDNETLNMGQFVQTFDAMDEPSVHGAENVTPISTNITSNQRDVVTEDALEFPNLDSMIQNCFALQQELGINYNGSLQSLLVDHVNYDQIHTVSNATNQWSQDVPKLVNDEATEG